MTFLRAFLVASTFAIYAITVCALLAMGPNWPAVFFGDLIQLDWRSQFNADFLIHLVLLATWIWWREGSTLKGFAFGFLSIFLGGMFGFPYILLASIKAQGDPKKILLGVRAGSPR